MTTAGSIFLLPRAAEKISRALKETLSVSDLLMLGVEGGIAIGTLHYKDFCYAFYNASIEENIETCSIPLTLLDQPYYLDAVALKKLVSCDSEYEKATLTPDPEWALRINAWNFDDEREYSSMPKEPEVPEVDLEEMGYRRQPEYRDLEKSGLVRRSDLVITQQEIERFVSKVYDKPAKATGATKISNKIDHSKSWHVNSVKKPQGYTQALYDTLIAELESGHAKPTAADVLNIWRHMDQLPNGVVAVHKLTFVYSTEKGSKSADLEALSQAIRRWTR